jgi:CheY-like chemotaxis protein
MERRVGAKLLILDDDPMVGKVLARGAERIGFAVVLTARPGEFFDQVVQWQPSHVAIDLSMPEMGGVQVLDRLVEFRCTARIIITSGAAVSVMAAALAHARTLGLETAGVLPKPFTLPLLRSLLEDGASSDSGNASSRMQ